MKPRVHRRGRGGRVALFWRSAALVTLASAVRREAYWLRTATLWGVFLVFLSDVKRTHSAVVAMVGLLLALAAVLYVSGSVRVGAHAPRVVMQGDVAYSRLAQQSASTERGLPFGPFHLPDNEFRSPFTGSLRGVSSPREAIDALNAARREGFRLILRLARGSRRFERADGSFDLLAWQREIDRYREVDFSPYVRDGTLLGHFLFDEPHDPTNWNGEVVPYEDIAGAAAYSRRLWPDLPTGIGSPPTALAQLRGSSPRGSLDFAFAQYRPRKGEVRQWLDREAATARQLGYGLMLSMNVLDGNGRLPLTAAQVRRFGLVLAQEPTACFLTMWKFDEDDPSYFRRQDIIAAMIDIARAAGARPAASCVADDARSEVPARSETAAEAILVGAGDIADCDTEGEEATGRLLDVIPGIVFTLGDHAYPDGTAREFATCFDRAWGRHKARIRPAPGNHDYHTAGALPYYDYFGAASGRRGEGYYSYSAGAWHVIVLNSAIGINASSRQLAWLREDLARHRTMCALAYFHRARFSSGRHGSSRRMAAAWQVLYDAGVDVVLSAHDHLYERFAPQTPDGAADPKRGVRQFTVGTGGAGLSALGQRAANSEWLDNEHYGLLRLTLRPREYAWEFLEAGSGAVLDSGRSPCH